MQKPEQVFLTEICVDRNVIHLTYVCDLCFTNPRLKRKHKEHYHGGGNINSSSFKAIDWNQRFSFGLRVRHCSNHFIHYYKPHCLNDFPDIVSGLPPVELIYDPERTKLCSYLSNIKLLKQYQTKA